MRSADAESFSGLYAKKTLLAAAALECGLKN
jgi:hypothetical protein